MNTSFYHRRFWGLTIAPLAVFFFARFLFVVGIPSHLYGPAALWKERPKAMAPTPARVVTPVHWGVPALPVPAPLPKPAPETAVQTNSLSLQSGLHEFHYIFSGQVTCGNQPCAAELHVSLQSDHNDDLKQILSTGSDGRFTCQITFKENLKQPLDWHVMVYTPNTYPVELRGRQILMDDVDLDIVKTIQLP